MADNKITDWEDVPTDHISDWEDVPGAKAESPSMLASAGRGVASGATAGFDDEIIGSLDALGKAIGVNKIGSAKHLNELSLGSPTLDSDKLLEAYRQGRDSVRKDESADRDTNPVSTFAGGVAGAIASPIAKLSPMAQGAVQGLGGSDADLTRGDIGGAMKDTALGGALGYGVGKAIEEIPYAANFYKENGNKLLAKLGSLTTGADSEALLRNITRPAQVAAAMDDGFSHELGKKAVSEVDELGSRLGSEVDAAKTKFYETSGDKEFSKIGGNLADKVDGFLERHAPSGKGFSALSEDQRANLTSLSENLRTGNMTGEDLVKVRDYLDQVEKLANKYGEDTGPYANFLKSIRGQADSALDRISPEIDQANSAFAQFKGDTGLLRSATNESQAEKMINNLYGANKGAQQEAAGRLFSPETLEQAKDIAANKAIEGAKRPGAANYFRHGALPVMTLGTSELATNPSLVAKGLRGVGTVEQKIDYALKNAPQILGKYAPALQKATERGPQAVAATHFILQQTQPEYREKIREMEAGDDSAR